MSVSIAVRIGAAVAVSVGGYLVARKLASNKLAKIQESLNANAYSRSLDAKVTPLDGVEQFDAVVQELKNRFALGKVIYTDIDAPSQFLSTARHMVASNAGNVEFWSSCDGRTTVYSVIITKLDGDIVNSFCYQTEAK